MQPTQHDDPALAAAQRFFAVHGAEHLQRDRQLLVDRCSAYLVANFSITTRRATDIALHTHADVGTAGRRFFDIDRSTAQLIVLQDPASGDGIALTVGDIITLLHHMPAGIAIARG